jgi:hypothetical protein
MNLSNSNLFFSAIWAAAETALIAGGGFRVYLNIAKKLDRIEYAIFNDGNGMKQQVEDLHDNQQTIKTDIAVLKAKAETKPRTRKAN